MRDKENKFYRGAEESRTEAGSRDKELPPWLRVLAALTEHQVQFPPPHGDSRPSSFRRKSSAHCRHTHAGVL